MLEGATGNRDSTLIAVYQEVGKSLQVIEESRLKIYVPFFPLASGAAAFLFSQLIELIDKGELPNRSLYFSVALFGLVLTLAVFTFELRWMFRRAGLIFLGRRIEHELDICGQFNNSPPGHPISRFFYRSATPITFMYSFAGAIWIFFILVPSLSVTYALVVLIFLAVIFSFSLWKWLTRPLEDPVEVGPGPSTASPPIGRPGPGTAPPPTGRPGPGPGTAPPAG